MGLVQRTHCGAEWVKYKRQADIVQTMEDYMRDVNPVMSVALPLAMMLAVALITSGVGYAQTIAATNDVRDFINPLIGEWIGVYEQFTDGKKAGTNYFHAIIKQSGPDTYQTVFEYYRLDEKTGAPVPVGESIMNTTVASDGTATNNIIGKGEVAIDSKTTKPEQHDLSEVLRVSPSVGLQGSGSGRISVSGMPLGLGKNGKVTDYHSDWTMQNGALMITQELKVKFRLLLFSKSFVITAKFTGNRGSDIAALVKSAGDKEAADSIPQ